MIFTIRVNIRQIFTDVKQQMCLRHPTTAGPCGPGIHCSFGCILKEAGIQIIIVNANACRLILLLLISLSLDVIEVNFDVDRSTSLG